MGNKSKNNGGGPPPTMSADVYERNGVGYSPSDEPPTRAQPREDKSSHVSDGKKKKKKKKTKKKKSSDKEKQPSASDEHNPSSMPSPQKDPSGTRLSALNEYEYLPTSATNLTEGSHDLLAGMNNNNNHGQKQHTSMNTISTNISQLTTEQLDVAYIKVVSTAQSKGQSAAIDEAFHALDLDKTGNLDRAEIQAFFTAAAQKTKLDKVDVNNAVMEAAVDALMHDAGCDAQGLMTKQQFHEIFDRHPDMLAVFGEVDKGKDNAYAGRLTAEEQGKGKISPDVDDMEDEDEENWVHNLVADWKSNKRVVAWIGLYVIANVVAFTIKAIKYEDNDEAQAVFWHCITVARGCANCLNLNACLVVSIFPICFVAAALSFFAPSNMCTMTY